MTSMTQAEQEQDRYDLESYLSCTSLTVRRCEHDSCERSALWVFDKDGRQIASVSRLETSGKYRWEARKIIKSQPVTRIAFEKLLEASAYVVRCC